RHAKEIAISQPSICYSVVIERHISGAPRLLRFTRPKTYATDKKQLAHDKEYHRHWRCVRRNCPHNANSATSKSRLPRQPIATPPKNIGNPIGDFLIDAVDDEIVYAHLGCALRYAARFTTSADSASSLGSPSSNPSHAANNRHCISVREIGRTVSIAYSFTLPRLRQPL